MKTAYLILAISLVLTGCSSDDVEYATINGKIEHAINGDGIANQSVIVMTQKTVGSGMFATIKELDRAETITDNNGKFSVNLTSEADAFVTIVYEGDEDYAGSGTHHSYYMNEPIILKVYKYIKFKVLVKNINPVDENDFILIHFFAGLMDTKVTKIENFGVDNTYHPEEPLPGGGAIGAWEETSWTGTNVNSNVYFSVPESAEHFKIRWYKKKNGIDTEGFTDEIPHDINELNTYSFEY